jgi:hypothetical protein
MFNKYAHDQMLVKCIECQNDVVIIVNSSSDCIKIIFPLHCPILHLYGWGLGNN